MRIQTQTSIVHKLYTQVSVITLFGKKFSLLPYKYVGDNVSYITNALCGEYSLVAYVLVGQSNKIQLGLDYAYLKYQTKERKGEFYNSAQVISIQRCYTS